MKQAPTLIPDGIGPPYTSSYGYVEEKKLLYQFTRNYRLIEFEEVPPHMWGLLWEAPSKSGFMRDHIVSTYKYRIVPMEEMDGPIDGDGVYV